MIRGFVFSASSTPLFYRNAWYLRSARLTITNACSCVASRITGGATPASAASIHREAQRHQRSPGFRPLKPYSGRGVDKSLPCMSENTRNSSVTCAHTVWLPVSSGSVSQQPLRVNPVRGARLQVCNVVPSTFRAMDTLSTPMMISGYVMIRRTEPV